MVGRAGWHKVEYELMATCGEDVDDVAVVRHRWQHGLEVEDSERVHRHWLGETEVVARPAVAGGTAP